MTRRTNLFISALLILVALAPLIQVSSQSTPVAEKKPRWYRGNLHTHTSNSDGDSSPEEVVEWYKTNRYDFVVITDHEHITPVDELNSDFGKDGTFLVISGQEVTDRHNKKPYHVNALGLGRVVMPQGGTDVVSNLQKNVDAVREAGGIPLINHPNFGWAVTAKDLLLVERAPLLEIYSGHPLVNFMGGGGIPSVEQMWDSILTAGRIYFGVAVDDVHHLKRLGDSAASTPGHGWVVVRAPELSSSAILSALERGDFYASSGVELADYVADKTGITVTIKEARGSKYRTQFIGANGKLLAESIANPAVYRFKGKEKYVRAKIFESNGKFAWTQPAFRK